MNQIVARQRLQKGWNQEVLDNLGVTLLAPIAGPFAVWLARCVAGLGVGRVTAVSYDEKAAIAGAAKAINPYVGCRNLTVRRKKGFAPYEQGSIVISLEPNGQSIPVIGGISPHITVRFGGGGIEVLAGNGIPKASVFGKGPGPCESYGYAMVEVLLHVLKLSGAYGRASPNPAISFPSHAAPDREFALFLLGAGAVTNCLVLAMDLAGIRPRLVGVCDCDTVDETNLNRQVVFGWEDRGKPKAVVMAHRMQTILGCQAVAYQERFRSDFLSDFVKKCNNLPVVVALVSDNWTSRLQASDAAAGLRLPVLLHAGTSFEGGRARMFGPSIPGSWCLGCGSESARTRARPEEQTDSCSRTPTASMVVSSLAAASAAVGQLASWLRDEEVHPGGVDISLVTPVRYGQGPRLAPCACTLPVVIGYLHAKGQKAPVMLNRELELATGCGVVGARMADGSYGAVVVLDSGAEALGPDNTTETFALVLRQGQACVAGGKRWVLEVEHFRMRARFVDATRCCFCLSPVGPDDEVMVGPDGHVVCLECAGDGSCPWCDATT